jgi:hypothetical protein
MQILNKLTGIDRKAILLAYLRSLKGSLSLEDEKEIECFLLKFQDCLSVKENIERNRLIELQSDHSRFFTQEEFDRLQQLNQKAFENSGAPEDDFIIINRKNIPTKEQLRKYFEAIYFELGEPCRTSLVNSVTETVHKMKEFALSGFKDKSIINLDYHLR